MEQHLIAGRRSAAIVTGAAALGLVLLDMLRVWMPSLIVVLGEGLDAGLIGLTLTAVLVLGCGSIVALGIEWVPPRVIWIVGAALLLGGRLALTLGAAGGTSQLIVSSVAVAGGTIAVVGLAAGSSRGDIARIGLLGGAALSFAIQAVLGGVDLASRAGLGARFVSLVLVAVTGLAIARATRHLDGGRSPAAWPWASIGPVLVLLGVLGAPAGRIAVATGWEPGATAAAAVGLQVLLVIGALGAGRLGPLGASPAAAVLVLTGTSVALAADRPLAVLGQAGLMLGLGLVVGSGLHGGNTTPTRRGVTAGMSMVLFGVLLLLAYAGYLTLLPFGLRSILVLTASFVAVAALIGALRAARLGRELASPLLVPGLALTLAIGLLLAGPASLRGTAPLPDASPAGTLRVALANVHFGHDVEGRQRAREVGSVLAAFDADVIALNEVDRGWFISGGTDLLSTYASMTGMRAVFGPSSDEMWGNAILTRLPILEVERTRLPRGRAPLDRSALTVIVEQPDGRPLAIIATHLSNVDLANETRLPQAQSVAAIVARLRERDIETIVAGDLNARPGDPELEVLAAIGLRTALPDTVMTYPAASPRVQIDHVLIPSGFEVITSRALNSGLSDHRFLEITLERASDD